MSQMPNHEVEVTVTIRMLLQCFCGILVPASGDGAEALKQHLIQHHNFPFTLDDGTAPDEEARV